MGWHCSMVSLWCHYLLTISQYNRTYLSISKFTLLSSHDRGLANLANIGQNVVLTSDINHFYPIDQARKGDSNTDLRSQWIIRVPISLIPSHVMLLMLRIWVIRHLRLMILTQLQLRLPSISQVQTLADSRLTNRQVVWHRNISLQYHSVPLTELIRKMTMRSPKVLKDRSNPQSRA